MLGIPVNASAKDLAANKGKMKLLEVGKEVTFPLDLPDLLTSISRTKESVATAERDINLPQDKIKHALFWFAHPSDPLGKLAYDHLLQGNIDTAITNFKRSASWESRLCLSTLCLIKGDTSGALSAIWSVLDLHCEEFVHNVVGQTYSYDVNTIRSEYLSALGSMVDILEVYPELTQSDIPDNILEELRNVASTSLVDVLENEIAKAKAVDSKDAPAQLEAGKSLSNNTHRQRRKLEQLLGTNNLRYSRLADKLANQILQCSINYFNNVEGENREIIDNALKLGEYALKIAVGRVAKDHIQHNVDILRKKKENLPPAEVENEVNAIMKALAKFVDLPDKIEHSVTLLNDTKPHLNSIRLKLGSTNNFYLKISTQVVSNALHNIIEEVNLAQREQPESLYDSQADKMLRLLRIANTVSAAWNCTKNMDTFDMESDFRTNRYNPNRNSLQNMHDQLRQISSLASGTQSTSTYSSSSYGSTSNSSENDTNWGCIIWGIIGFIIFIIIMANQ